MKCVNLKVLSLKDFYPKKDEFRFKNWQEQYCNSADSLATFSVSINSVAQFLCDQLEDLFLKSNQSKLKKLQSVYEDNSAIHCCHIEFRKLEHDKT